MMESFEDMLTGGHPNSLGRTLEVVEAVLAQPALLEELYQCYFSDDEIVRLRVSSAMKRVCIAHQDWMFPYLDRLIVEISQINQASTQWTLALLYGMLEADMTPTQKQGALKVMQSNLKMGHDWIVLNNTMATLTEWAKSDQTLRAWLLPHLERLSGDSRQSVMARAKKFHKQLRK